MEPLPEVRAAASQLAALSETTYDLMDQLAHVSSLAEALLPSCVGVSITVLVDGDPLTVSATSPEMSVLDAAQYLMDGPCVTAASSGEQVHVDDVLDEQRWQDYALTAAAHGVRSSLSVALRSHDGQRVGALNLYASEPDAFSGKHALVAELFGGHVEDVISNADLSFLTREFARELPQRLLEHDKVNQAVGVLMVNRGMSATQARERLAYAASRAGIPVTKVADMVMILGTA